MNIDTDEDFPEHPKTRRFCALLGNPIGWAYLWKLWRFCAKYQPDGDLTRYLPAEIEMQVGWTSMDGKFFAASVSAGFIDQDERGIRVHDWHDHMGAGLIRMNIDRLRKALFRATRAGDAVEAARLEAAVAALRSQLLAAGTRTSDGRPADVQRTSSGQLPNGDGQTAPVQRMSDVSALLCSALQEDLSPCDPSATEHHARQGTPAPTLVVAPGAPLPVEAPVRKRKTGHDLLRRYGEIRSTRVPGTLPWAVPASSDGKAETFAERLTPDEEADVDAALQLHFTELLAGKGAPGALQNPTYGFGCWVGDFTRLREKLHQAGPSEPAPPPHQTRPRWTGRP